VLFEKKRKKRKTGARPGMDMDKTLSTPEAGRNTRFLFQPTICLQRLVEPGYFYAPQLA